MTGYSSQEYFNCDSTKIYSDLCLPLSQSDSILIHVKLPNNDVLPINFALRNTILDVKRHILPALESNIESIQQIRCIFYDGHQQFETNDHTLLKYYWKNYPLQLLVNIKHHEANTNVYHIPNFIAKRIDTNAIMPKPTLGYRNKKTGKFYKNSEVQTLSKPTDLDRQNINSLATQTTETQDKTTEVGVESGTQTQSIDILRPLNIVREIGCQQKFDWNPIDNRDDYARVIQKSVRTWIARKKIENMLKYYYYLKQLTHNEEKNLENAVYVEHQKTIINLQYPTRTKDFEALYSTVHDNYKRVKIKSPKSKTIEKSGEELTCLKEISKRRNRAKEVAEEKKVLRLLNEISKPIVKIRKNGESIYIETPETYQAKQFMDFYVALKKDVTSKSERIELLLEFREHLERFIETDLTNPLIDLINRELTVLNIVQLNNDQLKILRRRIEIEFQRVLKQSDINPAIAKQSKAELCLNKCYKCRRLKSLNKFVILLNLTKTTICKDCRHLHRITTQQINLMPHENILQTIKDNEAKMCAKSSLAFFLSAEDIYYLVTIIWKAKSAISESKDIVLLRLVRWHNEKDWSPSNTILLTIEEAYVHSKIRDVHKAYSTKFINEIQLKHVIANNYFKGLTTKTTQFDRNNEISKYNNRRFS